MTSRLDFQLGSRDGGFGMHWCFLDEECRVYDAPKRVYIGLPWGQWIIGLTRDDWTQIWLPKIGYLLRCGPVVWHPATRRTRA